MRNINSWIQSTQALLWKGGLSNSAPTSWRTNQWLLKFSRLLLKAEEGLPRRVITEAENGERGEIKQRDTEEQE